MALKSHLCAGIWSGLLILAAGVAVRAALVICVDPARYGWFDFGAFWFPTLIAGAIVGGIVGFLSAWIQIRKENEERKKAEEKAREEEKRRAEEARRAEGNEQGGKTGAEPGWSWQRVLLVWGAIGFGVLLGGGVAARAYMAMSDSALPLFALCQFWLPLVLFSAGGGLTIGLLILVWWLVVRLGFNWALGFVVLALVLVGVFVWPTPYRYSDVVGIQEGKKATTAVFRINRLTGHAEQIYPKE